ncbi:MAG TPA: 16S rRNA (cytosine(1402)-N(4))-methyltransferase RsmH [Bacteroidetes bacterium]|nr:16S rRNA (cytosine(1402)-N(4))-methyltransferase RsmH [Bacteroidota bacterium]
MTTTELLALRHYSSEQNSTRTVWNHLSLSEFSLAPVQYRNTGVLFDIQLNGKPAGKGYYQLSEKILKYASAYHVPVMLKSVLGYLITDPSGIYVDGTLGGGGHAEAILERLSPKGKLIGIDWDADALQFSKNRLKRFGSQLITRRANFDELPSVLHDLGLSKVDGILLDLGVSSHQLDSDSRGFSYLKSGPLDMRMNGSGELTAFDVINQYAYKDLKRIFKEYGEERQAGRVALAILKTREKGTINTTDELAEIIRSVIFPNYVNKTLSRIFQAVRIEINQDLVHLQKALKSTVDILKPSRRAVVISYHSLEDRLVKHFFKKMAQPCEYLPELPIYPCEEEAKLKILTQRPVRPSAEEAAKNPRARSAKLRAAERI